MNYKNLFNLTAISLIAMMISFSSCKKDEDSDSNPFIGTWVSEMTERNDDGTVDYYRKELTFDDNSFEVKTFVNGILDETVNGTYSYTSDTITAKSYGETQTNEYRIKGNTLTIYSEGEATKYTKK